jgi:hypothetical protein
MQETTYKHMNTKFITFIHILLVMHSLNLGVQVNHLEEVIKLSNFDIIYLNQPTCNIHTHFKYYPQ